MGRVICCSSLLAALAATALGVAGCSSSGQIGGASQIGGSSQIGGAGQMSGSGPVMPSGISTPSAGMSPSASANAPSTAQLQQALLAGSDVPGLGQNHTLDFRIAMYLYPTNGGCAPMDQLTQKLDSGGPDFEAPTASIGFDLPAVGADGGPGLLAESVEYYGDAEAAALMNVFHAMQTQCQQTFQAPEAGEASASYVIQPQPDPVSSDCVVYYLTDPSKQPSDRYVVDRVGGTLVTFSASSSSGPAPAVDASLITAAENKVRAAGLGG
ncbi:hypothetical protein [Catenulispora pinisilvae]|uniref:hypothetical protein n=1 Tax=Catenulispora pinisilvae TaxID=2705253 RepID=UPI001892773E|nr:hypothetical protein [Catenulispora pinisilvae]